MGLWSRDLSGRGCWHSRHLNIYFIPGGVLFSSIHNSQQLCGIPSELKPPSCSPDCQAASAALSWLFLQAPGSGFLGFFFFSPAFLFSSTSVFSASLCRLLFLIPSFLPLPSPLCFQFLVLCSTDDFIQGLCLLRLASVWVFWSLLHLRVPHCFSAVISPPALHLTFLKSLRVSRLGVSLNGVT